jgi:hypothetical protein
MSDEEPTYVISLGTGTDDHRNAVQAIIKRHAVNWWHYLPDLWIVIGHDHTYWADLVKPVLALSGARLLVLELPRDKDARMFAYRGEFPAKSGEWLWNTYHGRPKPNKAPSLPTQADAAQKP